MKKSLEERRGGGGRPGGGRPGGGRPGGGRQRTRSAPMGTYRIVLTVDGKEYTSSVEVKPDPTMPETTLAQPEEIEEEEEKDDKIDD